LLIKELEVNLIKAIAQFPEIIKNAAKSYQPNLIALYLFSLAQSFNSFYKVSPVLRAETEELKNARLYLCKMTGIILRNGLGLLGIQCPEKM
jgi:arginyl-tRNA synthetase